MKFIDLFKLDLHRYGGRLSFLHQFRFLIWFRLSQTTNNSIVKRICKLRMKLFSEHYGLEIPPGTKIGKGLYIGHPFNITINPNAKIGCNVNIHKGVTIGQENRGQRKGSPIIGNCVWIGVNATVVGKVVIGDNVMIAPNSFVNIDIPSNSIVYGNPCIVKPNLNATQGYVNNKVNG